MRKRHEEIKFYKSMTYRNKVRKRTEMNIIINQIMNNLKKAVQVQIDATIAVHNVIDDFFNPEITYTTYKSPEGIDYLIRK